MCIPSSPYQPPHLPSPKIAATPPTLQPLSFTFEPSMDLNALMSSAATPAVTFIPPDLPEGPEPTQQQRIHHVHSDCGHYGSPPQLNRSHSLLRNFSLRSRNTLRKRQNLGHRPLPSLSASRPKIARKKSTSAPTASSGSSLFSVWKKWVKNVTSLNPLDGEFDVISTHHHTMSLQGPVTSRKRNLFLPVGRLIPPFQIPSSTLPPSDDSPCIIIVSFHSI